MLLHECNMHQTDEALSCIKMNMNLLVPEPSASCDAGWKNDREEGAARPKARETEADFETVLEFDPDDWGDDGSSD